MCRHLAYLGPPVTLHDLLLAPEYSLARQAWAPRMQVNGTMNVEGFGAGWYAPARPEPVRYRRAQPIWTDASFASMAPTIASTCVLAAVRSATPAFAVDECCAAPFTHGRWLFSHNGVVADWAAVRRGLPVHDLEVPDAGAPVDSALLFGRVVRRLEQGAAPAEALAAVVREVQDCGGGRLNLLLTDGERLAATRWGDVLHVREQNGGVLIASEPHDDGPGWREVPQASVVETTVKATESRVRVLPLGGSPAADHSDESRPRGHS